MKNNKLILTLYKEDYTEYSWNYICRDLNLLNTNNVENLKEITINIESINKLQFN